MMYHKLLELGSEEVGIQLISKWLQVLSHSVMRNAGLDEAQAGIKIARRNINNFRYADDTTLMAESEEEASWWKWKKRVKKSA